MEHMPKLNNWQNGKESFSAWMFDWKVIRLGLGYLTIIEIPEINLVFYLFSAICKHSSISLHFHAREIFSHRYSRKFFGNIIILENATI